MGFKKNIWMVKDTGQIGEKEINNNWKKNRKKKQLQKELDKENNS